MEPKYREQLNSIVNTANNYNEIIKRGRDWMEANNPDTSKTIHLNNAIAKIKKVQNVAQKKPSVALFGASQVGKSYLVNILAKPTKSPLMVHGSGGEKINFLNKINPSGGGNEATGVITRFTHKENSEDNTGYCHRIELLTQMELACVLIQAYTADLQDYIYQAKDTSEYNDFINTTEQQNTIAQNDIDIYEILTLKNFILTEAKDDFVVRQLSSQIDRLLNLLLTTPSEERWKILHLFWGENEFFTNIFNLLSTSLATLENQNVVFANNDSIINDGANSTNIFHVNRVFEIGDNKTIVTIKGSNNKTYNINICHLATLTKEVELKIDISEFDNPSNIRLIKNSDLLDFPGCRSFRNISEQVFNDDNYRNKLTSIVRGKVGFLFKNYIEDIGISTLLFCMNNKQVDVPDLKDLIYFYIKRYIGTSYADRLNTSKQTAQLLNGDGINIDPSVLSKLMVVFTQMDIELECTAATEVLGQPDTHNYKWENRLANNLAHQMQENVNDKWVDQWDANNNAFKFIFPIRNPRFSGSVFNQRVLDNGFKEETSIRNEKEQNLKDLTESFLTSPHVDKHFIDKHEVWNEVLTPNRTGSDYFLKYLEPNCHPLTLISQLSSILQKEASKSNKILKEEYKTEDIAEELKIAKKKAANAFMALVKMRSDKNELFGFLNCFQIQELDVWKILFNHLTNYEQDQNVNEDLVNIDNFFNDLDLENTTDRNQITQQLTEIFGVATEDLSEIIEDQLGMSLNELINTKFNTQSPNHEVASLIVNQWKVIINNKLAIVIANMNEKQTNNILNITDELLSDISVLNIKKEIALLIDSELQDDITTDRLNLLSSTIATLFNEHLLNGGNSKKTEVEPLKSKEDLFTIPFEETRREYIANFSKNVKNIYTTNVEKRFTGQGGELFNIEENNKLGAIIEEFVNIPNT